MARRLRIQFPGARYPVINRGNLRHDSFATAGARHSFAGVTGEACEKFGWRMHAYIVMGNHFHLALETPEPYVVAGMHWLESTFAGRLLRFHGQHGHVFQESGRFRAELTSAPKSAPWKRALAHTLRDAVAPPYRWLAEKLCMGKPGSVRAYVHAAGSGVVGRD